MFTTRKSKSYQNTTIRCCRILIASKKMNEDLKDGIGTIVAAFVVLIVFVGGFVGIALLF